MRTSWWVDSVAPGVKVPVLTPQWTAISCLGLIQLLGGLGSPHIREVSCVLLLFSDRDLFHKFQIKYGKYCLIASTTGSTVLNAPVIELPFPKSTLEHNQEQEPRPFNRYVSWPY